MFRKILNVFIFQCIDIWKLTSIYFKKQHTYLIKAFDHVHSNEKIQSWASTLNILVICDIPFQNVIFWSCFHFLIINSFVFCLNYLYDFAQCISNIYIHVLSDYIRMVHRHWTGLSQSLSLINFVNTHCDKHRLIVQINLNTQ